MSHSSARRDEPGSLNLEYIEGLLADFQRSSTSVPREWQRFFESQGESNGHARPASLRPAIRRSLFHARGAADPTPSESSRLEIAHRQDQLDQLLHAYRTRGHMIARLDPLGIPRPPRPELDPGCYGFTEQELDHRFSTISIGGANVSTIREVCERLQRTYCRAIGVEFMHIDDPRIRDWLSERMESSENSLALPRELQFRILTGLTDAVIFEEFVRKKYVGAKTFSLEGAESLIPLLGLAIDKARGQGVREVVLGMAHRGRLNVLANILGKRPQQIFWEFEDPHGEHHRGQGDVKYHLGYSSDWASADGQNVHLSLCFNPSHLEFINPVALGRMRAKQDRTGDRGRERGLVLLIHGDAAFAGEGIVQETLNLSQLPAYEVGGALHVIVNNQIGFTTAPGEARSSTYATDIAKMLQTAIFHVNGEYPEAVAQVVDLAMDFRRKFRRDVVIDMYGYRRWGHNEGDEPSFTQPVMYQAIERRRSVRDSYLEHLLELGEVTREEADRIADERRAKLEAEFELAQKADYAPAPQSLSGVWTGYVGGSEPSDKDLATGVDEQQLAFLLEKLTELPAGPWSGRGEPSPGTSGREEEPPSGPEEVGESSQEFHLHPKLQRAVARRREMARGERPLDWAAAEALALATLAVEQHPVRLTGQDAARGTFSQRHAVLHDVRTGRSFMPLQHLTPDQAPVEIYNSPLSEAGVLGFEYGYSLDYPSALVAWEAQYGDFCNAAQVIIDQFLASAEVKWRRLSGLVLLLPHGYEGQGPEHSSARVERWLVLSAEHNLQVVMPTTPAQYFHLLRRQVLRRWRKPLVVFTPKSLLRHPQVVSDLQDCARGAFQRVLPDPRVSASKARRLLLCSGKVYYDLLQAREEAHCEDVAIIRLEQLYPLPREELAAVVQDAADGTSVCWVQEEPANMGAWQYLRVAFGERLFERWPLRRISRPASASPAGGSSTAHKLEQQEIVTEAFAG